MKTNDVDSRVVCDIKKYLNAIEMQEYEIDQHTLIKKSLTDSLVREVRSLILPYNSNMLDEAWIQQNKKKKAERPMFEFVKNDIFERLNLVKKAKFDKIVLLGVYKTYGYSFYFTYEKIHFELRIPNVSVANVDNIEHMHYGQYSLHYEDKPSLWRYIDYSYNLDNIAKALDDFINDRTSV